MEHIALNGESGGRRLLLAGLLLVIGVLLLVWGFMQLLSPGSEWVTIRAGLEEGTTCGEEFTFLYRLGGEPSPRTEQRAVTECYTRLCRRAYQMFQADETFSDATGLGDINCRPNTELKVEAPLYRALETVERSGSRALYLGPVYDRYEGIFFCQEDSQLADFDPRISEEVRLEYQTAADFANDPESIRLELLGEGRVRLYVSEEYLSYARREGIETFIDFAWMRNAFIADYLAGELELAGYGRGVLTSYDGFVRNMDRGETDYSLTIYDRREGTACIAAGMPYRGPMSAVSLRDFPVSELDSLRFYRLENGEIRTCYVDPADGIDRAALPSLTCYGADLGCGEILLAMLPVYVADAFQAEALDALSERGIQSVYCQGNGVYSTDPHLALTRLAAEK